MLAPQPSRYASPTLATPAEGWTIERLTPPSRLFGANGIRAGRDGRLYVAQVSGSQISAIDPDTSEIEVISALGGAIVAPDDLVFDEVGNLYVTEITEGRVSMLAPNGTARVIYGDMPVANPITYHQGRLIAGECRMGARIMELSRDGSAPRIILEDVPMANAFEVGPDGKLYFPVMGANEIWRVSLDGGPPEVVAGDLGVPDSVKFDKHGFIISTQVASGQVLRIDPSSGARTVLADLGPGLDNSTFIGDRLFVSSIPGHVFEILASGEVRPLIAGGLQWPLGLAVGTAGEIFIADGAFDYTLRPGGGLALAGMLFSPGCPGYIRAVASAGSGEWLVTTGTGQLARFWPTKMESEVISTGHDQLMGVATTPNGRIVFAEYGTGRVLAAEGGAVTELARDLDKPMGVAIGADGTCYVSEAGAGRVVKLVNGNAEPAIEGLGRPEGLACFAARLALVDTFAKQLISLDLASGVSEVIAEGLPVGSPPGVTPKFLGPIGDMSGPMINFCGLAAAPDGALYISGDAEGSVIAVRPR